MKILSKIAAVFTIAICFSFAGCGAEGIRSADTPAIDQIIPQTLQAGSGSTTLKIIGSRVSDATVVLWNGTPLATTLLDSTSVASPVDSASLANPGVAQLQLMNSATGAKSPSVQLNISRNGASLAIASTSLPGGMVGVAYNATLKTAGGVAPFTWSFTSGRMPAGLALDPSGVISGTPTAAGTFSIGLTVRDKSKPAQQRFIALTLIIARSQPASAAAPVAALAAISGSLPAASYAAPYSQSLQASGGTLPYGWSIASGSLPPGVLLASSGAISGTPTMAGTFAFSATVRDSSAPQQSATVPLSITVNETPLRISTASLPAGTFGAGYSQPLSVTGGSSPYKWSVASGSLPPGLSLGATGSITGTPTASGTFAFTLGVSDASNPVQTQTGSFSVTIAPPALRIATTALSAGTVGSAYSQALSASGGTPSYSWSIASGSLPAGLALSTSGIISGTPSSAGTASFVASVTDRGSPAQTQSVPLTISVAPPQLKVTSGSLASGTIGRGYSATLQANGGTPGYNWSIASGSLPAGLTLNAATGAISGTPTASGAATFTATATDSGSPAQTASAAVSIAVAPAPLAIVAASLPAVNVSTAYQQALQATGGTAPYRWSITSGQLPAGLTFSSGGAIFGTPTAAGTATFTATVTDSGNPAQTTSLSFSIIVNPAQSTLASVKPLSILAPASTSGTAGSAYYQTLGATGGTSPYAWSITSGTLPAGLALSSTGVIAGTLGSSSAGSYSVTVSVSDAETSPQTVSATMSISVAAAPASPLSIVASTLASGTAGATYSQTLQATGGTPSYTWSISSGSLPSGLSMSTAGVISGTPSSAGTSTFTATVADNGTPAQTKSVSTSIAIAAPATAGTTWFVRPDGGNRYSANVPNGQCNGMYDAPYPGSGVNQNCAFNDVRYMWMDGSYGNSQWVMNGGDTLVIRGCSPLPSQQNPDPDPTHCRIGWDKGTGNDSQNFWCAGVSSWWGCSMPPVPSGTASQHTRILGACAYGVYSCNPVNAYPYTDNNLTQLFGGFNVGAVMYLSGSQYVDVEGLEITTHNGQCTEVGSPAYPKGCSRSKPMDDFANWGIVTTNTTSNITLQDLYIHGFTQIGLGGPVGGPISVTRVISAFNAFAGWNFDDGSSTPDAPGSTITQSYVTMIGNGCLEEYPIVHTQFPALACWDSNDAGFGDAWSGQDTELDGFSCDHCTIIYNVKDAAMGPHTLIHNLSITNEVVYGNMGQQEKWGTNAGSTTVFENNLIIGNCHRMALQIPGAAQNFNQSTGLPGSYLTNYCRAAGDVFSYFSGPGSNILFAGNTIIATSPTVFDLGCSPLGSCGSTPFVFKDNVILGYTSSLSYYPYSGEAPGLYYLADSSVPVSSSYNVEYGVRNGDCPRGGSGNVCGDPLLVNEPAQGSWPPETALDNFNFHLTPGSPAVNAGVAVTGLTTDFYGVSRLTPSIGAVQP